MVTALDPGPQLLNAIAAATVDGIVPRIPATGDWRILGAPELAQGGRALALLCERVQVLSAVESPEGFPEYHVSVSVLTGLALPPRRIATDQEMERVRAEFGMGGADEDNHGPGIVRHLWMKVGQRKQEPCPCKQDEQRIVEGDRVRFEEPR